MSARLMVQQQFRQGKRTYRPGDELLNEDLAEWSAEQRANRFADGFIGYDDPGGETVNGAIPGAKLRVIEPFNAGGRTFVVGEVFERSETKDWPAISLGNRIEGGFLEWTTPEATDHPKAVKAKQAAVDAKAAEVIAQAALRQRNAEANPSSDEAKSARKAIRDAARAERAAKKQAAKAAVATG